MCAAATPGQHLDRRVAAAGSCLSATAWEPGLWECDVDGDWTAYTWPHSSLIEQAYCRHRPSVEFQLRGMHYRVDFQPATSFEEASALQVNARTGMSRKIRRWPSAQYKAARLEWLKEQSLKLWEAWMKADNAWCLLEPSEAPHLASAAQTAAARTPPAREPYGLGANLALSEAWWPELLRRWPSDNLARAAHPLGRSLGFAATRVAPPGGCAAPGGVVGEGGACAAEWSALCALWSQGGHASKAQLVGAFRVQSRPLLQGFAATRQAMLARLSGEDSADGSDRTDQLQVRLLWHGTKAAGQLADICNEGFDRARAQVCAFGKGCYFATSAAYSDKYACDVHVPGDTRPLRAMLVAAVLVGEYTQGTHGMYPPPVKPHSRMGERYENTCDNLSQPLILVTFKDHQAVPVYVMVYSPTK
mmetsp:Transcript_30413/g.77824  ORF Transcript_30413/g.77824 Transcript_30413/m.77824 type:complete len:418 (-) Transcript_30413:139-1392(-)|eukprot:CAMPEP_0183394800 /NCGR_PEP_ID=MMETSP0370-20130417/8845_1 /TAXON_ID=268820 /ORGANISM="Peridinium aciculiferum, Strain PAER-2" /LENGTH=417 /DNA_ID=CAMNT_0025575271 /DNA_START=40 /DNA_END=1293 /DNA_ORIENTATION=+